MGLQDQGWEKSVDWHALFSHFCFKCFFRSSILCFLLAVRLLLLVGRSSGSVFCWSESVPLCFLGLYNRHFQSDFSLLFQLMLFQVSAEDILHNLVSLAYFRPCNMWLFDIYFSKNSYFSKNRYFKPCLWSQGNEKRERSYYLFVCESRLSPREQCGGICTSIISQTVHPISWEWHGNWPLFLIQLNLRRKKYRTFSMVNESQVRVYLIWYTITQKTDFVHHRSWDVDQRPKSFTLHP